MVGVDGCASASTSRRRLVVALAAAVLLLGAPGHGRAAGASSGASDSQPGLKTVMIPVEGMSCVACAATVKRAVKSLAGVVRVEVSLEQRTAQVTYAPDKLTPDRIVAAIDQRGYRAGSPRDVE